MRKIFLFLAFIFSTSNAWATADKCITLIDDVQYDADATTNGSSFKLPSNVNQAIFVYQVTHNGTGTLDVALEHSFDDTTFLDIISSPFTQATSADVTETLSLNPYSYPMMQYIRPVVTVASSGDYNLTLTVCYGYER